jgi:hypothetical protein
MIGGFGMFFRKEPERRSIEDILTPKDESDAELEEKDDNIESESENKEEIKCEKEVKKPLSLNQLDCFCMEEDKTEQWLAKCAKFWFCVMSFGWFLFGAVTFAPIIYIRNKVDVFFNNKRHSLLFSLLVYAIVWLIIVIFATAK